METKPRDQKQEREGFSNKKEVLEIKIFTIPLMYLRLFFFPQRLLLRLTIQ